MKNISAENAEKIKAEKNKSRKIKAEK